MGAGVTLVMAVLNQLELTRACLRSLTATREPFELVVIDNGSTDGTAAFLERWDGPFPLRVERGGGGSVIAALNRGWRLAETDAVCLLHNDTVMVEPTWLSRLLDALGAPGVGLAGLDGVKRVRRNGRYVGRTIVHSLADGPTVRAPWEEVAVVDGVCLCLRRAVLESVGGFDESLGFFHGYDRDLSFAVRETGRRCVVAWAPFHHRGGGTRTREFAAGPEREYEDLAQRRLALDRFVAKWRHRLPCDVRARGERVRDWLRRRPRRSPVS